MTDDEIKAGAEAFRATLIVAGGRTSFDHAVRHHLVWFSAMLDRGLGWGGVIRVLSAEGIRRDNGLPLSRGHLSGVYWRQVHARRSGGESAVSAIASRDDESRVETISEPSKTPPPAAKHPPAKVLEKGRPSDERQEIQDFMKRAATLRRSDLDNS